MKAELQAPSLPAVHSEQRPSPGWQDLVLAGVALLGSAVAGLQYSSENTLQALVWTVVAVGGLAVGFRLRPAHRRVGAWWADVLAILHGMTASCLSFLAGFHAASEVPQYPHQLWLFAVAMAVLAWGLWFRRPWTPIGIRLVYVLLLIVPLVWALKDNPEGMALAFVIWFLLFIWSPFLVLSAVVIWTVIGRNRRQVFSEQAHTQFQLGSLFVWVTLFSLVIGGFVAMVTR